jgi:Domain of unknown function (DUF5110)
MPVFVAAGGIIAEQAPTQGAAAANPGAITVLAYPGKRGSFTLYQDAGTGLGYTSGQRADTTITTVTSANRDTAPSVTVRIGATRGRYPRQRKQVAYRLEMKDLSSPTSVSVNGRPLGPSTRGGPGWRYDAATATVVVQLGRSSIATTHQITETGGAPVERIQSPST